MKILSIISILFLLICSCSKKEEVLSREDYIRIKQEFSLLKNTWETEAPKFSSNTNDSWKGKAGKKIISMGKKVLPFVMEEITKGNFFFIPVAEKITGISLKIGSGESEQAHSLRWIKWWNNNKFNPTWNLYPSKRKSEIRYEDIKSIFTN